jgi:hypothetical protein
VSDFWVMIATSFYFVQNKIKLLPPKAMSSHK